MHFAMLTCCQFGVANSKDSCSIFPVLFSEQRHHIIGMRTEFSVHRMICMYVVVRLLSVVVTEYYLIMTCLDNFNYKDQVGVEMENARIMRMPGVRFP